MDAVKKQFATEKSKVRAQVEFAKRHQEQSETINEYVTALRSLAPDCDFGDNHGERLAIQLIVGCKDAAAQKLCLRLKEPALDQVLDILRTEEVAETTQDILNGKHKALKLKRTPQWEERDQRSTTGHGRTCSGCGSNRHRYRSVQCPAKGQACAYCDRLDHFEDRCFQKEREQGQTRRAIGAMTIDEDARIADRDQGSYRSGKTIFTDFSRTSRTKIFVFHGLFLRKK